MIRVIIERSLIPGSESAYYRATRQLKQKASHMPGYISGEILVDPENPLRCLILSTWQDLEYWEAWAKSEARKIAKDIIRLTLTTDEIVSVYQAAPMAN